jgi:thioredoxin 1
VAHEYAGKAKVGKLDADSNGNTAMRYRIQSIPTLLLFKGGKVVAESLGAISKTEVYVMLDAHL